MLRKGSDSSLADWKLVETEKSDHLAFLFGVASMSLLLVSEDIC
jgi:hypothetical protein